MTPARCPDMGLQGEMRAVDAAKEIEGTTAEVAELLEHIRDTNPQWQRKELLNTAIDALDEANELAVRTEMELQDSMTAADGAETK